VAPAPPPPPPFVGPIVVCAKMCTNYENVPRENVSNVMKIMFDREFTPKTKNSHDKITYLSSPGGYLTAK